MIGVKLLNFISLSIIVMALPILPQNIEVHGLDKYKLNKSSIQDCHRHLSHHQDHHQDAKKSDSNQTTDHSCHDSCHMACCHITLSVNRNASLSHNSYYQKQVLFFAFTIGPPKNISIRIFRPPIIGSFQLLT